MLKKESFFQYLFVQSIGYSNAKLNNLVNNALLNDKHQNNEQSYTMSTKKMDLTMQSKTLSDFKSKPLKLKTVKSQIYLLLFTKNKRKKSKKYFELKIQSKKNQSYAHSKKSNYTNVSNSLSVIETNQIFKPIFFPAFSKIKKKRLSISVKKEPFINKNNISTQSEFILPQKSKELNLSIETKKNIPPRENNKNNNFSDNLKISRYIFLFNKELLRSFLLNKRATSKNIYAPSLKRPFLKNELPSFFENNFTDLSIGQIQKNNSLQVNLTEKNQIKKQYDFLYVAALKQAVDNLLNNQPYNLFGSKKFNNKSKIYNVFLAYKKSFLSYWLLPFLGIISVTGSGIWNGVSSQSLTSKLIIPTNFIYDKNKKNNQTLLSDLIDTRFGNTSVSKHVRLTKYESISNNASPTALFKKSGHFFKNNNNLTQVQDEKHKSINDSISHDYYFISKLNKMETSKFSASKINTRRLAADSYILNSYPLLLQLKSPSKYEYSLFLYSKPFNQNKFKLELFKTLFLKIFHLQFNPNNIKTLNIASTPKNHKQYNKTYYNKNTSKSITVSEALPQETKQINTQSQFISPHKILFCDESLKQNNFASEINFVNINFELLKKLLKNKTESKMYWYNFVQHKEIAKNPNRFLKKPFEITEDYYFPNKIIVPKIKTGMQLNFDESNNAFLKIFENYTNYNKAPFKDTQQEQNLLLHNTEMGEDNYIKSNWTSFSKQILQKYFLLKSLTVNGVSKIYKKQKISKNSSTKLINNIGQYNSVYISSAFFRFSDENLATTSKFLNGNLLGVSSFVKKPTKKIFGGPHKKITNVTSIPKKHRQGIQKRSITWKNRLELFISKKSVYSSIYNFNNFRLKNTLKNNRIKEKEQTPDKSLKKAFFLLDYFLLNNIELNNLIRNILNIDFFVKESTTILNNPIEIIKSASMLNDNMVLFFQNKKIKSTSATLPCDFKSKPILNMTAQSELIQNESSIFNFLGVESKEKMLNNRNILYNLIFQGLNKSFNKTIEASLFTNLNITPYKSLILKMNNPLFGGNYSNQKNLMPMVTPDFIKATDIANLSNSKFKPVFLKKGKWRSNNKLTNKINLTLSNLPITLASPKLNLMLDKNSWENKYTLGAEDGALPPTTTLWSNAWVYANDYKNDYKNQISPNRIQVNWPVGKSLELPKEHIFNQSFVNKSKVKNQKQKMAFHLAKPNNIIINTKKINKKIDLQSESIKPDNSFLVFSQYLKVITNKIQQKFSPYQNTIGHSYLWGIDNTLQSKFATKFESSKLKSSHKQNNNKQYHQIFDNTSKFLSINRLTKKNKPGNFERVFLSYLSKSKLGSQIDFINLKRNFSPLVRPHFCLKKSSEQIPLKLKKLTQYHLLIGNYKKGYFFDNNQLNRIKNNSSWENSYALHDNYLPSSTKFYKNVSPQAQFYNPPIFKRIYKTRIYIASISKKSIQAALPQTEQRKNFLILLKNRLFINKKRNNEFWGELKKNNTENKSKNTIQENRRKKQQLKLKRRLKKMQCATRRRKKRKIFYPRPKWLTFTMYEKFLNSRYNIKQNLINNNSPVAVEVLNGNPKFINLKNEFIRNSINLTKINKPKNYVSEFNAGLTKSKNSKSKDFYKISPTVSRDLRRILMKSSWLRNYLNTYLNKIKYIYKEIETDSKNIDIFFKLKTFIQSFYGSFFSFNIKSKLSVMPFEHSPNWPNSLKNNNHWQIRIFNKKELKKNAPLVTSQWNSILNFEYHRIIYQRIQRIIFNIRENLNINGQIKNRSQKLGKNIRPFIKRDYIKRDNNITGNQTENMFSKNLKKNLLNFRRNFIILNNGYEEPSIYTNENLSPFVRNNFYWSLNRIEKLLNTNSNSTYLKNIWEKYKIREINKNNKTKKMIFNIFKKYNDLLNDQNVLDQFRFNLENDFTVLPAFFKKRRKQTIKFSKKKLYLNNNNNNDNNNNIIPLKSEPLKMVEHKNLQINKEINISKFLNFSQKLRKSNILYNALPAASLEHQTLPAVLLQDKLNFQNANKNQAKNSKVLVSRGKINKNLSSYSYIDALTKNYINKSENKLINIEKKLKLLGLASNNLIKPSFILMLDRNGWENKKTEPIYCGNRPTYRRISRVSKANVNSSLSNLFRGQSVTELKNQSGAILPKSQFIPEEQRQLNGEFFNLKSEQLLYKKTLSIRKFLEILVENQQLKKHSVLYRNALRDSNCTGLFFQTKRHKMYLQSFDSKKVKKAGEKIDISPKILRISPLSYKKIYFRFLKQQLLKENKFFLPYNINKKSYISPFYLKKLQKAYYNIKQQSLSSIIPTQQNLSGIKVSNNIQNYNKFSSTTYWWTKFKLNSFWGAVPNIKIADLINTHTISISKSKSESLIKTSTPLISFIFHFCTLVAVISLGSVRSIIKFYYILLSKLYNIMNKIRFTNLFKIPRKVPKSSFNVKSMQFSNKENITWHLFKWLQQNQKNNIQLTKKLSLLSKKRAASEALENKLASRVYSIDLLKTFKTMKFLSLKYLLSSHINFNMVSKNEKTWTINSLTSQSNATNKNQNQSKEKDVNFFLIQTKKKDQAFSFVKYYLKTKLVEDINGKNTSIRLSDKIQIQVLYNKYKQLSIGLNLIHKVSFYIYLLLLKSIDILVAPAFLIYKFFEKPGEYVVENLAYSFLLEWSADLISTIPDSIDPTITNYFYKMQRNLFFYVLLNPMNPINFVTMSTASPWVELLTQKTMNSKTIWELRNQNNNKNLKTMLTNFINSIEAFFGIFLLGINNSILRRFVNSSILLMAQQITEPDLDYINRQKKGIIFWDLWGESLKTIAEKNSVNIYELSTDKEEQLKLLSNMQNFKNLNQQSNNLINMPSTSISNNKSAFYMRVYLPFLTTQTKIYSPRFKKYIFNDRAKSFSPLHAFLLKKDRAKNFKVKKTLPQNNWLFNQITFQLATESARSTTSSQRWAVNQFLNYQGKDTDLFIDLHPPRTFSNAATSLKYAFSIQAPIGTIVCQIFGGIFYKQISKNILVVLHNSSQNHKGLEKSSLIQAIAGETELKIITDNAHRYAMVVNGVAVGIKLLKDVFEALCATGPCIFLIEDIHAIGERRPFLIDETSPNLTESIYNKNQSMQGFLLKEKNSASREILYKTNKHLLTNYKKPYKEFKSLASNHFSFTFLYRAANLTKLRTISINSTEVPLSIQVSQKEKENQDTNLDKKANLSDNNHVSKKTFQSNNIKSQKNNSQYNSQYNSQKSQQLASRNKANFRSKNTKVMYMPNGHKVYGSFSQLIKSIKNKQSLINPPAASPFNLLLMKESTKMKPNKSVKEMTWFGLPGEQYSLISKYNYSVRVKVALLADSVLSNLSVKLEMITDLLVIIDSVKGNRGFIIFATTHLPDILDPALRRPGRFDETLSLPFIPALYSRWTNYRYNIKFLTTSLFKQYTIPLNSTFNKGSTLDFSKYPVCYNDSQFEALFPIYNSMVSFGRRALNVISIPKGLRHDTAFEKIDTQNYMTQKAFMDVKSQSKKSSDPSCKIKEISNSMSAFYLIKNLLQFSYSRTASYASNSIISLMLYSSTSTVNSNFSSKDIAFTGIVENNKETLDYLTKKSNKLLLTRSGTLKWPTMLKESNLNNNLLENYSNYLSLFGPINFNKNSIGQILLISFITYKFGENFGLSLNLKKQYSLRTLLNRQSWGNKMTAPIYAHSSERILAQSASSLPFLLNFNQNFEWKNGPSLLYSYIHKRIPYMVSSEKLKTNLNFSTFYSNQLLHFNNKYSLMEPPSPPITNILLPAKRYENYRRSFKNFYNQNFESNAISEKLKLHQQQRLLKRLYNYPIKEFFRNEKFSWWHKRAEHVSFFAESTNLYQNNTSLAAFKYKLPRKILNFTQSYFLFAGIENFVQKNMASSNQFSSIDYSYRNILYNRHKTYLINQWWNGQQGEHNLESTFLSDIDWRYTQISSSNSNDDIQIDFPDCEQFYNPRNRRWILTKGDWSYWFNIEADLNKIYSHYIYEALTKAYKNINQNREFLDFHSANLLSSSFNLLTVVENTTIQHICNKIAGEAFRQKIDVFSLNIDQKEIFNLYKRFFYKLYDKSKL